VDIKKLPKFQSKRNTIFSNLNNKIMTPSQLFAVSVVNDAFLNLSTALKNAQSEGILCKITLENKSTESGEISQEYGVMMAVPKSKQQDSSQQKQTAEKPVEEPAL
jgi:hypothetical protein